MSYTGSYLDSRNGIPKNYDQYYCSKCRSKRTFRRADGAALSPNHDLDSKRVKPKKPEKVTVKSHEDGSKSLFGFVGSIEELLEQAGVDLNVWEVQKWEMDSGRWEVPMKITSGPNEKRVQTPHKETAKKFKIRAVLVPKKGIIDKDRFRRELMEDVQKYAPKVHKLERKSVTEPHLLLLNLYDLHLDKVAWHEETGHNWDLKIARKVALEAVDDLVRKSSGFEVDKILVPVGHDFFNSDYSTPFPRTTKGTPQESDSRYQNVFRQGRKLWIDIIDTLKEVADVDVHLVPGNHDEERSFYLIDALSCFYHNDENVNVSDSPVPRRYYQYGNSLIGLAHGKDIKASDFPQLMAIEARELWAKTLHHYWKLGHLHHAKKLQGLSMEDMMGVVVEYLPSLTATDAWHFSKGFTGAVRKATADIFSPYDGQIASFSTIATE